MDAARLRDSFARVAVHGDELPLFFYSDLFIKHPEVRDMFPVSMESQRGHLRRMRHLGGPVAAEHVTKVVTV